MNLSIVDIVAYVIAGCMAASRAITALQPLWAKLPKWLAVLMPVFVLTLPQIASAAGLVKTSVDLVQFIIVTIALLVPGIAAAESASAPALPTTTSK